MNTTNTTNSETHNCPTCAHEDAEEMTEARFHELLEKAGYATDDMFGNVFDDMVDSLCYRKVAHGEELFEFISRVILELQIEAYDDGFADGFKDGVESGPCVEVTEKEVEVLKAKMLAAATICR